MNALICPLCSFALLENPQGIACVNRHQFDRSKDGYFNLLPAHQKNSREPGDAKQQLTARRLFLNAGYFSPLVVELKKIISHEATNLLDIGCGEGYFTRSLQEHCPDAQIYGIDISKAAIRLAAKSCLGREHYVVASSHLIPIANESMDVITRIYAPSKDEELRRTLKPSGKLIIVTPGERHLLGLRHQIYESINPHPKPVVPSGFDELEQSSFSFSLDIPAGELTEALLKMTPFFWKLKPALVESLVGQGLKDLAEFQLSVYERSHK
jgi:23S rRNA (guanine745-N1)-methyltransferase